MGLVHTDLAGPMEEAIDGSKYVIVFVDDLTRMRHVFPLKQKSDALGALKEYELTVARPAGLRIKRLRSDQGGEFLGEMFEEFCKEMGIAQEFSAPYTPQGNGISERSWRTIFEMARSSLIVPSFTSW